MPLKSIPAHLVDDADQFARLMPGVRPAPTPGVDPQVVDVTTHGDASYACGP